MRYIFIIFVVQLVVSVGDFVVILREANPETYSDVFTKY